jgi:hypothetical protein
MVSDQDVKAEPCNENEEQSEQQQIVHNGLDEEEPAQTEEEPPEELAEQAEQLGPPEELAAPSPTAETADLVSLKPKKAPKCQVRKAVSSRPYMAWLFGLRGSRWRYKMIFCNGYGCKVDPEAHIQVWCWPRTARTAHLCVHLLPLPRGSGLAGQLVQLLAAISCSCCTNKAGSSHAGGRAIQLTLGRLHAEHVKQHRYSASQQQF